jgi:hypothetical protein
MRPRHLLRGPVVLLWNGGGHHSKFIIECSPGKVFGIIDYLGKTHAPSSLSVRVINEADAQRLALALRQLCIERGWKPERV